MGDCLIDACVLKGASLSDAVDAIKCRDVIDAIRSHGHMLIVDAVLWGEWKKHLTRYSSLWLADVVSREQVTSVVLSDRHRQSVVDAIDALPLAQQPNALKDIHILLAAIEHNALVISSEGVCRRAYVSCGPAYAPIQGVYWVSPLICIDLPIWLKSRAAPKLEWLLVKR